MRSGGVLGKAVVGLVAALAVGLLSAAPANAAFGLAPPTNLRATEVGDTTVTLAWTPSSSAVDYYEIFANNQWHGWTADDELTVQILEPETTYEFTVRSVEDGRESAPSNGVTVTTEPDSTPPKRPTVDLQDRTPTTVSLRWIGNDRDWYGELTWIVSNGVTDVPLGARTTSYTFDGLTTGKTYTFTVRAKDPAGNISEPSTPVTLTADATPPSAPVNLHYGTPQNPALLTWDPAEDNADPAKVLSYRVYANGEQVFLFFPPQGNQTSVDLRLELDCGNLLPTGLYTVTAVDGSGNESAPSAPVEVDPF